jgi:ParB family chromosome partitioning protein
MIVRDIAIEKIKYNPRRRIRKELGDLTPLKDSMRKFGLFYPLITTDDYELLAGQRRLEAAKELGWSSIKTIVLDASNALAKFEIEVEENLVRKEFTLAEIERMLERRRELMEKNILKMLWLWLKKIIKWIKGKIFKQTQN